MIYLCRFTVYMLLIFANFISSMEIDSPTIRSSKKNITEQSLQDICFHPKSRYLIKDNEAPNLILNYSYSFKEILSGKLDKKTMNTNWQNRFFVLTPVRLLYFANQQRIQLKGCFNLAGLVEHNLTIQAAFPQILFNVRVEVEGRKEKKTMLVVQILNQGHYNEWLTALRKVVSEIKINLLHISIYPRLSQQILLESNQKIGKSNYNFWNKLTITPKQLLNYASHLDILFLKSKSTFSYLHRFFMRSQFDHVGVLLKDEAEIPYLLEVINQKGVIISPLENLLVSCAEEYVQIGYRKLMSAPNLLPLDMLEKYVNSLIGKKYELNLSKLFLDNETQMGDENNQVKVSEIIGKPEKTYFCSQLIADIYLKFGVLPKGKSNNFWPKDFEDEQLTLSQGYSLTPMMRIDIIEEPNQSADGE